MNEVIDWNGKPRYMWCWDKDEDKKCKRYVICILNKEEMLETGIEYPVRIVSGSYYLHCAEIEEETKRPCKREEFIKMLQNQKLPMLTFKDSGFMYYVVKITDNEVTFTSDTGSYSYTYEDLCKRFTLFDGSELWVQE